MAAPVRQDIPYKAGVLNPRTGTSVDPGVEVKKQQLQKQVAKKSRIVPLKKTNGYGDGSY